MILSVEQLDEYFIIHFPDGHLEFATEINPSEYLEYARMDLLDGVKSKNLINSVGNAKRALHLQVDTIVNGFGDKKLKRSSGFPAKLDFLNELGIATPYIISKLNTSRKKIEHDYTVPELEQTKDYCDIVELFLGATESLIYSFPDLVEFQSNESFDIEETKEPRTSPLPESLTIEIAKFGGGIAIHGEDFDGSNEINQDVTTENAEYSEWISQILEVARKH